MLSKEQKIDLRRTALEQAVSAVYVDNDEPATSVAYLLETAKKFYKFLATDIS